MDKQVNQGEHISLNSVTFACCALFFCHDSLEKVANIYVFFVVFLQAAKQKICNSRN